jgi:phosphoribosylaminoimidazole carboxylase PurK protein
MISSRQAAGIRYDKAMAQQTIGIIGGGQLGRMLTLAALPLGFKVVVLNSEAGSPAAQVGAEEIVGDLYDPAALKRLADRSDYLTIEIEHLDAVALETLEQAGKAVNPSASTVRLIQDKYEQKKFLEGHGIPVAPFAPVSDETSAKQALKKFGGRMLLKTRHGAYDGRGNAVIRSAADLGPAFQAFAGQQLYAEQLIPFSKELAVMVARGTNGEIAVYPVVETVHVRNICVEVVAPAPIAGSERDTAEQLAGSVAALLSGAGIFGIELFLTADGAVLVNEIAPRVHNSGHYTLEAARTSQFEQHIRAITGLPLGAPDMIVPAAVMINILGERDGPADLQGLDKALAVPHTSVHLYGKSPTKIDRKMGHVTATGASVGQARKAAREARRRLSI